MAKDVVGYMFVGNPDPDPRTVKQNLAKQPGVYFVAEFVGTFRVFAAVEHDTLEDLQNAIAGAYWQAGLRSETSELVQSSRLAAPKRGSPSFCGMIRAEVADRDPVDVLDELDARFEGRFYADPNHDHFWYGAAVVTGPYDLLIDLGADSATEIDRIVIKDVRGVAGIHKTVTAHAYLPNNGYRYGKLIPPVGKSARRKRASK